MMEGGIAVGWKKKGKIYCPSGEHSWELNTFMTPHALKVEEGVIRIWGGVRDSQGVSRIKYIDVEEKIQVMYYMSAIDHLSI